MRFAGPGVPPRYWTCETTTYDIQENGPTEEEVTKVTRVEQRKWESALQENLFWHELVVNMLQHRVYFKV